MKWFTPRCPVNDAERVWLEQSCAWLLREFKIEIKEIPVVLPTPEYFPDTFRGEERDIEALLMRVCTYMGVKQESPNTRIIL